MNTSWQQPQEIVEQERSGWFEGFATVFRRQMRAHSPWTDLLLATALPGLLLWITHTVEDRYAPFFHRGGDPDFLTRWGILSIAALLLICGPLACLCGADAVPPIGQFEATQSALLTRLTPSELCAGRLLAGLWLPISMVLTSCAFWLVADLIAHHVAGHATVFGALFQAHCVLLCFVGFLGAIAFLCALRRRPGRNWGRGAGVAFLAMVGCTGALFALNPLIDRMNDPSHLIEAGLWVNPVAAVVGPFQIDLLREDWLYNRTDAHDYPFVYPWPAASALLFALAGSGAIGLSARRLRRAYR